MPGAVAGERRSSRVIRDHRPIGPAVPPARLQARTAFKFADFALPQRRVLRILSVEDPTAWKWTPPVPGVLARFPHPLTSVLPRPAARRLHV